MPHNPLSGIRLWLSGSVPDGASSDLRERIERCTRLLAENAFSLNATLLHGFHPSLTPTLLAAARAYHEQSGARAPLHLFVAPYRGITAGSTYEDIPFQEIREVATLHEIPPGPSPEATLDRLRNSLASHADAFLALGGKWWQTNQARAGVPREFELAASRGLPAFLLAGLSGATAGYLNEYPEILRSLRNGLSPAANRQLSETTDIPGLLAGIFAQLALLPFRRREPGEDEPFRILCLDGGGVRGAFTAALLAQWEASLPGVRIVDHFDLIAGTSTGGILAIGLGLGLPAQNLLAFYRDHAAAIFPVTSLSQKVWRNLRQLVTAKFGVEELERQLALAYESLGATTLADSHTRLLIPSYNLTANAVTLYRTPLDAKQGAPRSVAVARATSAAPTYFPAAVVDDRVAPHEAVDGGVWANCPALAAIAEAVGPLRIPLRRIQLLSLGTAGFSPVIDPPADAGVSGWAGSAANLFLQSQMQATLHHAAQLLGPDAFLRIDDPQPTVEDLDDPQKLPYLISRGQQCADSHRDLVQRRFLNGHRVRSWRDAPGAEQ
ncbi:MAG: patatin-like phospholipase family protein [Acidobacteriaceae bacterium]|nr:patatin-like phospholipase family protein [Acidobacteriaceae bacterium]